MTLCNKLHIWFKSQEENKKKVFFGPTYPTICQLKIYHLVPKIDKRVAANIYCSKHQKEYDQPFIIYYNNLHQLCETYSIL